MIQKWFHGYFQPFPTLSIKKKKIWNKKIENEKKNKKTIEKNKKTTQTSLAHPLHKIASLRLTPTKQKKWHHTPKFVCVPIFCICARGGQKCHV